VRLESLTLCRSNLNPYCLDRKAAFFSALSNRLTFQLESPLPISMLILGSCLYTCRYAY
jgi:hypothetical protein